MNSTTKPIDLHELKREWLDALEGGGDFILRRPAEEAGCLYYSLRFERFVDPDSDDAAPVVAHFGRPGGVLPRILED